MTCHSHGADDQSVWSETICTVISTGSQEKNECWSLVQLSFVSCLQQRIYKNCKLECSCVQECNEYLDSSAASTECPSNYHIGSNWRPATPTRPSLLVSSVAHSTALQSSPRATFVQGCVVWRLFCSLGICTTPDEAAQPRHSGCCSSGCHISGVEYLGLQLLSVAGRAGCWLQKRSRLVVRSVAGNVTSQRPLNPRTTSATSARTPQTAPRCWCCHSRAERDPVLSSTRIHLGWPSSSLVTYVSWGSAWLTERQLPPLPVCLFYQLISIRPNHSVLCNSYVFTFIILLFF